MKKIKNAIAGCVDELLENTECMQCDICCRFPDFTSSFAPRLFDCEKSEFLKDESVLSSFIGIGNEFALRLRLRQGESNYECPFFDCRSNGCSVYRRRPLDCILYPFLLMFNDERTAVYLALDMQCRQSANILKNPRFERIANELADIFFQADIISEVIKNHSFIMDFDECAAPVVKLEKLTQSFFIEEGFKKLSLVHKEKFAGVFSGDFSFSSSRCFISMYLWKDLFNIQFKEIDEALCVFYRYRGEINMLLPPCGNPLSEEAFSECVNILKNTGQLSSRIENVTRSEKDAFERFKNAAPSHDEYLYDASDMQTLAGRTLRSKRKLADEFAETDSIVFRPLEEKDIEKCLDLYAYWARENQGRQKDAGLSFLYEDGFFAHKRALFEKNALRIACYVVEINGVIAGYTFGFAVNEHIFCDFAEVCVPDIKGLPQYIFRKLAQTLSRPQYINTMGDLGKVSLRLSKVLYRPVKLVPHYILLL